MKTKQLFYSLLFLVVFFYGHSQKAKAITQEQFKGLWILDKYEAYDTLAGKWFTETSRMGYVGYIIFDGAGHVAVQITPADYQDFNLNKKDSSGMKVVVDYYSNNLIYFADCKIEGNVIEHKILSSTNPESVGAILKREFEIKGKTLLLTPKNRLNGAKIRMKWVKLP
ncbi:MAG: lipocalin-like domain-containing protein [Bacteroidetes bacterium]|nr:lipocalin-like domain-containing protein [Bacteroidota bacterium]